MFWFDLDKQAVMATAETSGPLDNLVPMVRALTEEVLKKRGSPLTSADQERLHLHVTDSVNALEHFYRGLDVDYDRGLLPDALGEMLATTQQDSAYLDARLWTGRLFEAQGYDDHAVLAYRDLFHHYPREIEAWDALLFAARLLRERLHAPDRALALLKTVTQLGPASPEGLEASFLTGLIQRRRKKKRRRPIMRFLAYRALLRPRGRRSERVFPAGVARFALLRLGPCALLLYPDAMVHAILLYEALSRTGQAPPAPRGVIALSAEHPSFTEERFRTTSSLFIDPHDGPELERRFLCGRRAARL